MKVIKKIAVIVFIFAGVAIILQSCKKSTVPLVTTVNVSDITRTSAVSGGNVTDDGGEDVTARGVCWSIEQTPTIGSNKTNDGTGKGTFTSSITGLTANFTYYVRAYATNSVGTSYGNEVTFTSSPIMLATLTTTGGTLVTTVTAVSGGNITNDDGDAITSRGVCWGGLPNPTTANRKTSNGMGTGPFTSNLTGLSPDSTYYVRAYAINGGGTAYGSQITILTGPSTVTDADGNTYNTVTIGTQVWMKENLKTTSYRNSDLIGTSNPVTLDLTGESTPKYQWAYGGNESNVATYGRLYTWFAVTDSRNICPAGWHVPTDAEWTTLTTFLGGEDVAGGKLKEEGTTHWRSTNVGATNETSFTALPAGFRELTGYFDRISSYGIWWSSTPHETLADYAWYRHMWFNDAAVTRDDSYRKNAFSVRCVWGD